jgi:hypothetical protein
VETQPIYDGVVSQSDSEEKVGEKEETYCSNIRWMEGY